MSVLFISLFVFALIVLFYYGHQGATALYIHFVPELNAINKK